MPDFDPGKKRQGGELDKQMLEESLRDALKSVLGSAGHGVNSRMEFYTKFQREMEEHDRDFEKRYDEDLNTTLIFSGLFSAVTSAFIIDVQSDLKPNYEEMNNRLLEMLLNATTGTLPAGSAASVPRWSGPDPVIVQVQSIFYATLCATLLASFLAMLGKQWLNRYRQNETHGSAVDRSRVRERKLNGIEAWKFHIAMECLPLILQCALILLGFALSRYLWEVNRSVSSVVMGFTSFGLLFYVLITSASILSFDCPFQTPFSLVVRFVIGLATPYWRNLRRTFGPKQQPPQPRTLGARRDLSLSMNTVGRGHELEASITALACIAPAAVQFPWSVTPLFIQEAEAEGDRLDARCISRMFVMSTDSDVVTSIMDFIPEIIWHGEIKNVPLRRIYGILMDSFDFSGPNPAVTPKLRNVAYLSARAFAHIELQRRCITQYEEHKQDSWKALCAEHPTLSLTGYGADSDLAAALFMVDMTLGGDGAFPWEQIQMTPPHHGWMSHVFLYYAFHERQVSEVVMDFVEHSMSLGPPSDIVIADCLFIIGLMIGIPIHVRDLTVRDKSGEKDSALRKIFQVLSMIFSSKSIQMPLALRALRLVTRLRVVDVSNASYEMFKMIMASNDLTDRHWEAARLLVEGAWIKNIEDSPPPLGEPTEILKFLDHHLGLQGAGEDHGSSITSAMDAILVDGWRYCDWAQPPPLIVECVGKFDCLSPSFIRGVRSALCPDNAFRLRGRAVDLVSLISNQLFNSPTPVMEPEEMSEFSEHLAVYMIDHVNHGPQIQRRGVTILFEMLRSPEWRKHIATRLWSMFAHSTRAYEKQESLKWCLQNAIELLEFTRELPDGEGLRWWYGTLWFYYDKLDTTVRDEVENIARDMSLGDGLSELNMYLDLIGREVAMVRKEVDDLIMYESRPAEYVMKLRDRLVTLEGNQYRLGRIIAPRQ